MTTHPVHLAVLDWWRDGSFRTRLARSEHLGVNVAFHKTMFLVSNQSQTSIKPCNLSLTKTLIQLLDLVVRTVATHPVTTRDSVDGLGNASDTLTAW